MEENNFIITINRESGSGGREIAQQLGDILGVKVYDKMLLDAIIEQMNIPEEDLTKDKSWWDNFLSLYRKFSNAKDIDFKEKVTSKAIYQAQEKLLREICERESCIILGRTGFHIFKDYPNNIKIFIVADLEARVKRVCQTMEVNPKEARKFIEEVDATREEYTKRYTGVSRYDARNYDFVLNVTNIPPHLVAVFLAQNIRLKFKKD
ncbi:MAG: cytidylate kinase-like family protein [Bacteroidales bacterium]|nr:cytidylate kinase-like family protein [Bacteroidales bacterium]